MGFLYTSLPLATQLRVGNHPDVTAEYAGFTPNKYAIEVFLRGIFRDLYMNSVTDLKAQVSQPWLKEFIEEDPEAFLGDAFRHIEAGEIFPEKYKEVEKEGESLAPISGHHLNIITETDRTIEKWHIRISHNRIDYASYFKDYPTFKQFMEILKGNMMKGIKKSLGIIVKAVMCADPSETSWDDKDLARIFGRTWDWEQDTFDKIREPKDRQGNPQILVPTSELARTWMFMMRELINKYTSKARQIWRNLTFYNPYNFAFSNDYVPMNRRLSVGITSDEDTGFKGKDPSYQAHELYTKTSGDEHDDSKTERLTKLHRNDCLFALFDAISKAMNIMTSEEAPDFWLGQDTLRYLKATNPKAWKVLYEARNPATVVTPAHTLKLRQPEAHEFITTASDGDSFEVVSNADSLILLLNPEDYADLEIGIARRGQMDTRAVNLDMLRRYCKNIYPMRGMKAGYARLIDKRAFRIRSFFSMTDVVAPMEKITWRYKMFYQFAVTMFKNFAGTMFIPTPHFVASPRFYDKYQLIGVDHTPKQ